MVAACREESGPVSNHVSHIATHMAPPLCQLCSLGFLIINKMTDECNDEQELDFVFRHRDSLRDVLHASFDYDFEFPLELE